MKTIKLNITRVYKEGTTTKYWREIECEPQEVDLKTWGNNSPFFILKGKIIKSHDNTEIGKLKDVYIQTYMFWLQPLLENKIYSI